jgi:hypothetical protein
MTKSMKIITYHQIQLNIFGAVGQHAIAAILTNYCSQEQRRGPVCRCNNPHLTLPDKQESIRRGWL